MEWMNAFFSSLSAEVFEKHKDLTPDLFVRAILSKNIEDLMKAKSIKSSGQLVKRIQDKGFELSKSQISRVTTLSNDATTFTVLKLAAGLGLESNEYHYLLDPLGFDSDGTPIGKYLEINQQIMVDCANDAFSALSFTSQHIDIKKLMKMALAGYKARISGDMSELHKAIIKASEED